MTIVWGKGLQFPPNLACKLCQAFVRKTSYCRRLLPDQRKRGPASARLAVNCSKVRPDSHVCNSDEYPGSIADRSSPPSRMGGTGMSLRRRSGIRDRGKSMRLGCGLDADWFRARSTLALFSFENPACRLGCLDSRPTRCGCAWCSVLEPSQICAAISCDGGNSDLVHSTAGEAGMSLSRIPLTKLLECSVPNSLAISIDSSMTTAAGVPMRVIS